MIDIDMCWVVYTIWSKLTHIFILFDSFSVLFLCVDGIHLNHVISAGDWEHCILELMCSIYVPHYSREKMIPKIITTTWGFNGSAQNSETYNIYERMLYEKLFNATFTLSIFNWWRLSFVMVDSSHFQYCTNLGWKLNTC